MEPSIDYSTLPLRDIHLPDAISWWPPAPGWWLLIAVGIGAVAFALWQRHRQRTHRAALAALERITRELDAGADPVECLQQMSVVLRRFAISSAPSDAARRVPGMIGSRWLEYLDACGGDRAFREGPGRLLLDAPYAPAGALRRDEALEIGRLLETWVRSQRSRRRSGRLVLERFGDSR